MSWLIFNSEFLSKNLAGGVSVHYTYHVALQLKVSEQEVRWVNGLEWIWTRGAHISMGKCQTGFLRKHIIFPGCICFPDKNIRVEFFDPGK